MHVGATLALTAVRALARSMDVHTMVAVARRLLDRDYDLHQRTGFLRSIAIPNLDAARQVVADIRAADKFLDFVNLLMEMQEQGLAGRRYAIAHLAELVRGLHELGYDYDAETRMFVEDPRVRKTANWGVLREGESYVFTFLRVDVVGSSTLVRRFERERVEQACRDLETIVRRSVEHYNGRLWCWEGDGGLAAFFFSNKNTLATLAAIGIIHELFLYNRLAPALQAPVAVRIAVHNGPAQYTSDVEQLRRNETVKRVLAIESRYTKPDTVTVSNTVYTTLEPRVARLLAPVAGGPSGDGCHSYRLRWER